MNNETLRERVRKFLTEEIVGVVSTVNTKGYPESAIVYYVIDDSFNIYFTTYSNSRKYRNIKERGVAAFLVANVSAPQTVQVEGDIVEMHATDVPLDILKKIEAAKL